MSVLFELFSFRIRAGCVCKLAAALCLGNGASFAVEASSKRIDDACQRILQQEFSHAVTILQEHRAPEHEAQLALALAMLNEQPYRISRVAEAEKLLRKIIVAAPEELAAAASFFMARIQENHSKSPPAPNELAEQYLLVYKSYPGSFYGQLALFPAAINRYLANRVGNTTEMVYEEFEAHADRLSIPLARACLLQTLGELAALEQTSASRSKRYLLQVLQIGVFGEKLQQENRLRVGYQAFLEGENRLSSAMLEEFTQLSPNDERAFYARELLSRLAQKE